MGTAVTLLNPGDRQAHCWLALLLALTLALTPALSYSQSDAAAGAEVAGTVVSVSGEVLALEPDGGTRRLERRNPVYVGETIFTNYDSFAQMRMVDGALIRLNEFTEFAIVQYQYQQDPAGDSAVIELIRGGFRTITGAIGEQNKDAYRAHIGEFSNIGVRGTEYEAVVTPEGQVFAGVYDGGITLGNAAGTLDLGVNASFDYGTVVDDITPPQGLTLEPEEIGDLTIETVLAADADDDEEGTGAVAGGDADSAGSGLAGAQDTNDANNDNADGNDAAIIASASPVDADGQQPAGDNSGTAGNVSAGSGDSSADTNQLDLAPPDSSLVASVNMETGTGLGGDSTLEADTAEVRINANETSGDGAIITSSQNLVVAVDESGGDSLAQASPGSGDSAANSLASTSLSSGTAAGASSSTDDASTTTSNTATADSGAGSSDTDSSTAAAGSAATADSGTADSTTSADSGSNLADSSGTASTTTDVAADGTTSTDAGSDGSVADTTSTDSTGDGTSADGGGSDQSGTGAVASADDTTAGTDGTDGGSTTDASSSADTSTAGTDTTADSGTDTSTAGTDTTTDSGTDTSTAGADTSTDSGTDTSTAGTDTSTDTGTDGGSSVSEESYLISWGQWDVPLLSRGVTTEALSDGDLRVATSGYYADINPTPVANLSGKFRYGDSGAGFQGSGSAGDISNLAASMDVDFDSGAISNGSLELLVQQQGWSVKFDGSVSGGAVNLNSQGGQLFEANDLVSEAIEASLGGAFTGAQGETFVGGFELMDSLDTANTVQGIFAIDR